MIRIDIGMFAAFYHAALSRSAVLAVASRIGEEGTLPPECKSMNLLADANRMTDECSACLLREVIVSEAQAADHLS